MYFIRNLVSNMGVYVVIKFPLGLKLLKPVDFVFCCLMFITSNNLNLKQWVIKKINNYCSEIFYTKEKFDQSILHIST